jgi:hypothetical protein
MIWFFFCALLCLMTEAASRAACDFLFLFSQEKEAKEGNPATRVPSLRCGQPAVLDHRVLPQNSLRAFRASLKQLRQV